MKTSLQKTIADTCFYVAMAAFLSLAISLFVATARTGIAIPPCDICPAGTCDDPDLPHAPNPPETGPTDIN